MPTVAAMNVDQVQAAAAATRLVATDFAGLTLRQRETPSGDPPVEHNRGGDRAPTIAAEAGTPIPDGWLTVSTTARVLPDLMGRRRHRDRCRPRPEPTWPVVTKQTEAPPCAKRCDRHHLPVGGVEASKRIGPSGRHRTCALQPSPWPPRRRCGGDTGY
ncbi:hypothetical protein [Mycobacterium sp. 29Ha]|uniref:hypothetical protein n=1 Tax=Mycobacterium sp. 29Ha TaxID=2939268 RepID=UPI0029391697|nr:hypothetical protein [Mycobacterium sp. 29Ha]MDV3133256.1 hypothetical protein [Mycobacterium sp. 29Ha]